MGHIYGVVEIISMGFNITIRMMVDIGIMGILCCFVFIWWTGMKSWDGTMGGMCVTGAKKGNMSNVKRNKNYSLSCHLNNVEVAFKCLSCSTGNQCLVLMLKIVILVHKILHWCWYSCSWMQKGVHIGYSFKKDYLIFHIEIKVNGTSVN